MRFSALFHPECAPVAFHIAVLHSVLRHLVHRAELDI